jgi:hypothetical protein
MVNENIDMVDYNLSIMFQAKEYCGNYLQIQVPPTSNHPFWWKDNNNSHKQPFFFQVWLVAKVATQLMYVA